MAKSVQGAWADQADKKLYHHILIKILVHKKLEIKGMTWKALLKQLDKNPSIGKKTAAEKKTETPANTSKGPSVKRIPSCTSARRK